MNSISRFITSARILMFGRSVVVIFAVLFVWLRVTAVHGLDRNGNPLTPDLGQFYVAGQMAAGGEMARVYDEPYVWGRINELLGLPREGDGYPFLYPPFVPWLSVPLTWLPYAWSATLFLFANGVLAVWLGRSIPAFFFERPEWRVNAFWLFLASLPLIRCVLYGQNGLISLGIIWLSYLAWTRKGEFVSGAVLALGAYKPQLFLGVFLWVLLFGSNRCRLGLAAGGLALFALGCAGTWTATPWVDWLGAIPRSRDSITTYPQMHSWLNAFLPWTPLPSSWRIFRDGVWVFLVLSWGSSLLWLKFKKVATLKESFALALLGWGVVSPRFCQYDAVIFYPVIVGWWACAYKESLIVTRNEMLWITGVVISFYINDFTTALFVPVITVIAIALFVRLLFRNLTQK